MRAQPVRSAVAGLLLMLILAACSRQGAGTGAAGAASEGPPDRGGATQRGQQVAPGVAIGPNKSFAKITYRPEVKQVAASGFSDTLAAVSPDGHVLVFHDAPADIRALQAGDVMLIRNQLARKVLAVGVDGEDTYVITDKAMIGDVVKDGEINVDVPLLFSHARTAGLAPAKPATDVLALLIPGAYAQSPEQLAAQSAEQKGSKEALQNAAKIFTSGWQLAQMQYATDDKTLTYTVVLVKNLAGFIGKVAASGYIGNFRFWSNINVSQGLISTLTVGISEINGKLHFDWQVAKGTPGAWNEADPVKLPGSLSIPLGPLLEGLPLTLEISSAILIHPALTGGDQIQTGGFTINLNGGLHGSVSSGGAVAEGSSIDQTFQITNDTGLSAVAPDAMVIAYCAPRFELQLNPFGDFGKKLAAAAEQYEKYAAKAAGFIDRFIPGVAKAWEQLEVFKTMSKVLKSNADAYAQLVSSEGVVHSPAISMVPCSKKWIEFSGQIGTAANIAGMTPNAKASTTVFSKKYEKADPPSNFCEKVGT
jgi:hypothetical protein